MVGSASAAANTLVIAAPATPQSLDCNFDVSLGTFEAIAVLYDNLLEFKKIPDPKQPGAFREDTADHPDLPAGLAIQGKLAESFELDPGGKFIRFQLRQGIKSNWGNELTAEDVKWTWDRKFALGALGAFFLSTLGLENKDGVKVEGKYTVSINLDNPNPLLAKLQPNLYNPIYDSTKCKQESNADDPWARKFLENNSAGFGPYRLEQLQRGQQAVQPVALRCDAGGIETRVQVRRERRLEVVAPAESVEARPVRSRYVQLVHLSSKERICPCGQAATDAEGAAVLRRRSLG